MINRRLGLAFGGIGLSTVFFLPIAAAGDVDAPLMMWAPRHMVELLCAWLAVSAAAAGVLKWLRDDSHPRREAALLAVLAVPSALSLLSVTGRSAPEMEGGLQSMLMVTLVVGGLVSILAALLYWMKPVWLVKSFRRVFMFGVLLIVPAAMSISDLLPGPAAYPGDATPAAVAPDRCGDLFVLLFDELAYDAVFSGDRSTMGSLAPLAASARVYHRASSATVPTRTSIANYLSAPADRSSSRDTIAAGRSGWLVAWACTQRSSAGTSRIAKRWGPMPSDAARSACTTPPHATTTSRRGRRLKPCSTSGRTNCPPGS